MTLLKSLSVLPAPFPNRFCLKISPQVLRGEDPMEGNGGGEDWDQAGDEELTAAYHCLVFEELLQDLMLCTCRVTCLGKTLYRYHACCDAGPAAAVFTVQGSSQQRRSSGKASSLYIPPNTSPLRFFHFHSQCPILYITISPPLS